MKIKVELEEEPDWDQKLLYVSIAEMFGIDVEFKAREVVFKGRSPDVIACLAFYLLPMDIEEV